ncbi:molybdenum ABC transporter ATP-binding protein [Alkalimonas sp. MEB108]|uniref:Molybdenum ABC transporter ATP-binding protein n=1 Tax=Alkalimonas cellulosilytica TaxID=3058395 RepID=A0ABU7J7Q3_9GAMM|nr:molybdenum ABC transporter ATP-binding protein [Alkalimonas sp. MEB108]MEE2002372.1 molybdenum ABC transporter ATP-binding protein [Alkalimonas sp. MEB108]
MTDHSLSRTDVKLSFWHRLSWRWQRFGNTSSANSAAASTVISTGQCSTHRQNQPEAVTLRLHCTVKRGDFCLQLNDTLPLKGITALFGRSGCGKTSLLRAIAGLDRHASAHIRFGSTSWQQDSYFLPVHQRRIGMVFQESSLLPHLSVQQNLLYGYQRLSARQPISLKPEQVIALLELTPLLSQRPEQLSGGQRQRVALGRALLSQPQLLLLDEPLASLDQQSRNDILPFLQRIACETGIPMLLVSHQLDDVVKLADQLVLMQHGRIHSQGPLPQQLLRPELAASGALSLLHASYSASKAHLLTLSIGQQQLQLPAPQFTQPNYRLRIQARDVALSTKPIQDSSVSNQLTVTITGFHPAPHPAETLVQLDLAGQPLQALLTQQSVERLGLQVGQQVYAQIKAVALD